MKPFNMHKYAKMLLFMIADAVSVAAATFLALMLRFNLSYEQIDEVYRDRAWDILKYTIPLTILIFIILRLYQIVWSYAGIKELENILIACVMAACAQATLMFLLQITFPRSFYPLFGMVLLFLVGISRLSVRVFRQERKRFIKSDKKEKIMIVGAGASGNVLLREISTSTFLSQEVKCFIDDNSDKIGKYIQGVRVVGNRASIPVYAKKYKINTILVAMPSVSRKIVRDILVICQTTGCEVKVLPGVYQLVNGEVSTSALRKVQIEDLLGRDPVHVNMASIMEYVENQVVLITGGGGSIGSELCRQIAEHHPKQLIILDIYENCAYDIQQELKAKHPELNLKVLIASVCNQDRMNAIFEEYHPDIVYHAAAHKHVPLMEDSPNEAVENNVFGTLTAVRTADRYGVKRFVMISTDKAVNPTNIMGATKRICEMIIQTWEKCSKTKYVAVRFGNVLGSNGSVVPLFTKQLEAGGPITVTHPDIIRYFMTIPEAVSLVLQAGAYAKGGEIFVLDMGEPVKILDLAVNLIRQSGLEPYKDIDIKFIGLRPGEKMYEELLMSEEGLLNTENDQIHIGRPIELDEERFTTELEALKLAAQQESNETRRLIAEMVPTYHYKDLDGAE